MRKRSIHRYDATEPGLDTLLLVLSSGQALEIASRLLQHLRSGASDVELVLAGGQLSVRPPADEPPPAPAIKHPKARKKAPTMVAAGTLTPAQMAGGLRS